MQKPFKDNTVLSGSDLDALADWLRKLPDMQLTPDYKLSELVADLDKILEGMWSDGIDAMGEDA